MKGLISELKNLMKNDKILLTSFLFLLPREFNKKHSEFSKIINKEDLHENGIESNPHISLLLFVEQYKSIDSQVIFNKLPFEIKLGKLKFFDVEKFDCLYIDIEDEKSKNILNECYNIISKNATKSYSDYADDEYKPHCTIAYLKKGTAQKYIDSYENYFDNMNILIKSFSVDKEVFDIIKVKERDFS